MISQTSQPIGSAARSAGPIATDAPDAQTLQAQLAALVEQGSGEVAVGELRPLLEFLRALVNARAMALLPITDRPGLSSCVVTTRGVLASSLAPLTAGFDMTKANVQPAADLGADAWTLGVPVRLESEPLYWLIAQIVVPNPRDLQAFLVLLQTVAGYLLYREQRRAMEELAWVLERTSGLLDLFRRAGGELDFNKACRIAVDDLRDYLGCSRVTLGTRRRGSLHVRAISGVGRVDAKSPNHHPFEAAMHEALSLGHRIDFSAGAIADRDTLAHELLLQHTGAGALTTIPFSRESGALVLEWTAPPPLAAARLVDAATPFIPVVFDLIERGRPNAVLFTMRRLWSKATSNRRRALIAVGVGAAVLLAWPFHYSIKADCRLAPTVKRVIAAPFQGQLRKSFVQPGDRVVAGQALAEMDNRDLKLKESELVAARERALKQRDKALSNDGEGADFAAAQGANFEAQSVGQELELTRRKIALLQVLAPLDGVVVSGDLRRAEGQPVQQGQVLFEVAPLEEMIVEIDAPDREMSRVRAGLPVVTRLEAFGGTRWRSTIDKVHPQSEQRDGRNVFVSEAAIANRDQGARDLRPGMRGRSIIEGDRRPLIWIVGHRFADFVVESLFW